jgi:hypothetical protein
VVVFCYLESATMADGWIEMGAIAPNHYLTTIDINGDGWGISTDRP